MSTDAPTVSSRPVDESPPTERQLEILAFMRAYQQCRGAPPALREIGQHFGIVSTNGVSDHLKALHRRGLIRKHRGARCYVPIAMEAPDRICSHCNHALDDFVVDTTVDRPAEHAQ